MATKFTDNSGKVLKELDKAAHAAMVAVGTRAVEHTVEKPFPLVTGLLRNSITYAVGGEAPAIGSYTDDAGEQSGGYSGTAPRSKQPTVYIGTNVKYATHVEYGTEHSAAKPYLRPAINNHVDEYKEIIEDIMSKA